ncbi:MAG: phospholipase D-like domain-containing protein [Candidatus Aenigmarchaeota archaeon]|nr:phospholipase D-like domain-containing protein [Candidatus Aenigmarchaeota archaeon]
MRKMLLIAVIVLSGIASAADITAFLSPDSSYDILTGFMDGAKELKIASYTFDSANIAKELIKLDANITLLVEASPVGGLQDKEILCELEKNGIDVYLYNGSARFMHAKYMVKGNAVLVTTENFGSSGFGDCKGSRGWGAIINDNQIAREFSDIFEEDLKNSARFVCDNNNYEIKYEESNTCQPAFGINNYQNQQVNTIFAPDAAPAVLDLLQTAKKSIYIEQFYIYRYWDNNKPNLFLEAVINKARQGVDVKILLDNTWYHLEEADKNSNLNTAEYINGIARDENLSLEARLADMQAIGVNELHVKGVIVDDEAVFVSSINWNENSPTRNREAGVIITGNAADYFAKAFMYDWNGGVAANTDIKWLILVIVVLALVMAFVLNRRRK